MPTVSYWLHRRELLRSQQRTGVTNELLRPSQRYPHYCVHQHANIFFKDGDSDWVRANKPNQKIKSFLEGPSFDVAGNIVTVRATHLPDTVA